MRKATLPATPGFAIPILRDTDLGIATLIVEDEEGRDELLEAVGKCTTFRGPLSPGVCPAFPSSAIISERSSPSRVRCAAPNNGVVS
jgi:hypothetical protein